MILNYLRKLTQFLVMACCGVMVLTIFVGVVLRYGFSIGIPLSEDLPRYLMVIVTFLGGAVALDTKGHINITLFTSKLSRRNQLRLELTSQFFVLFFLFIVMIEGIRVLPVQWKSEIPTMTGVTLFWFYLGIPVGCALMAIFLTPQIVSNLREFRSQNPLDPGPSKNSIFSIAFIGLFMIALIFSLISYYSGSPTALFYVLGSCFALTVAIGMPVAISLGITGVFFFLISKDLPLLTVPTLLFGGISPFALTAITSFIFMGMLVERSGAVASLVRFANTIVGRVRGGLAHTNVVANMFMAGISGAALADCAAIGSILIPAMKEAGYDKKFSVVVTVSASLLGPIIPPSVAMIIYAYAVGGTVTVGGLFMSGVIPGVILGLGMMALNHFFAVRRNYPVNEEAFSFKEFLIRGRKAIWGLMIPAIILGGILLGVFTPTEAGAVAAAYGLFLGAVITRKLTWKDFKECLLEASKISGVIFLMLGSAKIITHTLTLYDAPVKLAAIMQGLTSNPYVFMFLAITLITLFGFVLEGVAIMIMLVPVLAPVAKIYGIEPHHFGLVVVMAIQLALLTPPVALGLFVGCGIAKVKIEEVVSDVWPYLFLLYAMIIVMACFPGMTLWLPKMLGYVK